MKMKNKIAAAGLILVFANLFSVQVQAAQTNLASLGEFLAISARASCALPFFAGPDDVDCFFGAPELHEQSRKNLIEKAVETCSGRNFSIDDSSIMQTETAKVSGTNHIYIVETMARVFCINY